MGGMAGKLAMTLSMGLDFIGMGAFAGSGGLLLDSGIATASNGYSLRKLRSAYAGSAIKIRRSSDDTTQDIGFSGNDLDTASIASFVGANSAYIDTWYDQVGSANLTQATTANQPRIVNAGALDTKNSKPTLIFDGTNDALSSATVGIKNQSLFTGSAVAYITAGSASSARILSFSFSGGVDYSNEFSCALITRNGSTEALRTTRHGVDGGDRAITYNTLFSAFTVFNGSGGTLTSDGTDATIATHSPQALYSGSSLFVVGAASSDFSAPMAGGVSESILWASALSAGDKAILVADTKAYWGTP